MVILSNEDSSIVVTKEDIQSLVNRPQKIRPYGHSN